MREVDASFKVTGHAFVVGKFTSVVIGSSKHPFYVWGEPVYDSVSDSLSRFVKDGSDDRIQRLALDQCHQRTPVALILFEPYRFLIRPPFYFSFCLQQNCPCKFLANYGCQSANTKKRYRKFLFVSIKYSCVEISGIK